MKAAGALLSFRAQRAWLTLDGQATARRSSPTSACRRPFAVDVGIDTAGPRSSGCGWSGRFERDRSNARNATFASGKRYNADRNVAHNVAARNLATLLKYIKPALGGGCGRRQKLRGRHENACRAGRYLSACPDICSGVANLDVGALAKGRPPTAPAGAQSRGQSPRPGGGLS